MPRPRSAPGGRLCWLLIGAALVAGSARAGADEPPRRPDLTAAQRERLKERDRLEGQVQELAAEGKFAEAIAAAEAELAIEREVLGPVDEDTIRSLERLARLREALEDWPAAAKALREILDRRVGALGRDHWRVTDARLALEGVEARARMTADQRRRLAEADRLRESVFELDRKGSYKEAASLARRLVAIREEVLGGRHPDYAADLDYLARILQAQGDLAAARTLCEKALAIKKAVLGERHPEYATGLNDLAGVLTAQGDLAGARALCERALALRQEVLGERHLDYAVSLNHLAFLLHAQGDLAAARPLYERALAIFKEAMGERDPIYATGLNNLAGVLGAQGDLAGARALCERALALRQEVLGERHPDYAASLNHLAYLLHAQGDLEAARPLYERALALRKEVLGERHPGYARSLNNLAYLLQSQGDLAAARPLFERALAINKDVLGERHPNYAAGLNNLAELVRLQGDLAAARPLFERALATYKEVLGERHPDYATGLINLAELLQAGGELAAARTLYERALAIYEEVVGERHPNYATGLNHLAYLLRLQGDLAAARTVYERANAVDERLVAEMLPALDAREQGALIRQFNNDLSAILSLPAGRAGGDGDDYRRMLAWKGLTAEAAAARAAAERPEARAARAALGPLRGRLQAVAYRSVPAERADEQAREVRALADRVAAAESTLARAVGWRPVAPDPDRVAAALPPDAAFVDILRYVRFSQPAPGERELKQERCYLAFVVRPGRPPARVELGSAAAIDEVLASWRVRLVEGRDAEELGRDLARLVWVPLVPHLEGIRTVLISPDADTCFLPWGALPDEAPGSVLLRRYAFGVVGSARQLLALAGPRAAPAVGGLLAVGGVDYDGTDAKPSPRPAATTAVALRAVPTGAIRDRFPALPGTADEVDAIAALARSAHAGTVDVATGPDATRDALRAAMPGHRYLHLATHGYFAPPEFRSALAPRDEPTTLRSWEGMGRAEVSGYYPGLLSGLVWAGASDPPRDPITGALDVGAGLMTAEEVSGLDLTGCDLAVLSACETGLGRTAGGEGVMGLQAAFHRAGCRTVVASLWKVEDAATSALMTRFYSNLWEEKLPPLEAMRRAQLGILDDPEFGDGGNPRLWAAWTLGGDPGGLPTLPPAPGAIP